MTNDGRACVQAKTKTIREQFEVDLGDCSKLMQEYVKHMDVQLKTANDTMDTRLASHEEHIQAIEGTDAAATVLIDAQRAMLSHRECGCCLINKLELRRCLYTFIGLAVIGVGIYVVAQL